MILGDVEEVVTTVEIDDETYEEIVRVSFVSEKLNSEYLLQKLNINK
jgi:hypothetical protein